MTLKISIYSDVICPWCYVGKRRFEAGVAASGIDAGALAVGWLPFELNPTMPAEGIARSEYRANKFGAARSAQLDAQMIETGRETGIAFDFVRQQRTPSTRLAHRLIWAAGQEGRMVQNALVNQLFAAYFEQGADIGRAGVLLDLAGQSGMDQDKARAALTEEASQSAVEGLAQKGRDTGIQGVPFFIVAGKYTVSGAQPPQMWIGALPEIAAELAAAG